MFGKAEKLARVLRESGTEAMHALSVGDEIRDIEAAQSAGIPCAAVTWGFSTREILAQYQPTHIFDRAEQISAFF
jgi:phosphoglycolate phosphatase